MYNVCVYVAPSMALISISATCTPPEYAVRTDVQCAEICKVGGGFIYIGWDEGPASVLVKHHLGDMDKRKLLHFIP